MYKSLYIHIPFCKMICNYCDFKREINSKENIKIYIEKIIKEINEINHHLETIYIGGGTPNILEDELLDKFLGSLQKNINFKTEFTIELNPELITKTQVLVLTKNNINRVSLGVQSTNNNILKKIGRLHTIEMAKESINLLRENKIKNISCDFINNLPDMEMNDVDNILKFINDFKINHISFYGLEVKEGSLLNKINYIIDEKKEEDFLFHFIKKTKLKRYEVSNWVSSDEYKSKHNLSYWNMNEWKGIGYGSFGFEKNNYIEAVGSSTDWSYKKNNLSQNEMDKDILIMGLRKIDGISLNDKKNLNAYNAFKSNIPDNLISIENNYLKVKDIDLLNEILINII